ncbi:porin [Methylobacterium sp. 4-46]|uniref:porin n=1 Tax=unclassified Methylobacterium TaxID=2615210 RepID=UPI000152C032|nr:MULTISPECIES: porin [Methylobacterium]ACA18536.1 porin [Methylobacterium sp. 4-46]WFT77821.1 porin [Methylobacterium nodulans]
MSRAIATLAAACFLAAPARALDLDLPRTPTPCLAEGPRFAALPGSGTCLRIGGRVAAEAGTAGGRGPAAREAARTGAGGRLDLDARTETEVGPARAFIRLRAGSPMR